MSKSSNLSGSISTQTLASQAEFLQRLSMLQNLNINAKVTAVSRDLTTGEGYGADISANTRQYAGGIYSPAQNRIYLAPYSLDPAGEPGILHYINCQTNQLVGATQTLTFTATNPCWGGAYHPLLNRIYFAPYGESNSATWHYIDCNSDSLVALTHGLGAMVQNAYQGAVWSATLSRLYFVPYSISNQTSWHYLNASGAGVAYSHGATVAANGYSRGVYSPSLDRIFFVPAAQSAFSTWHYLDCTTGNVVAYTVSAPGANYFSGGSLDPATGRLYLSPSSTGVSQSSLYYIDTAASTPTLNAFTNPISSGCSGSSGSVYSPLTNTIVFIPGGNALYVDRNFYSLNLSTLAAISTPNPHYNLYNIANAYQGGTYCPVNNTIYFVPSAICNAALRPVLRIKVESKDVLPRSYTVANIFNS